MQLLFPFSPSMVYYDLPHVHHKGLNVQQSRFLSYAPMGKLRKAGILQLHHAEGADNS